MEINELKEWLRIDGNDEDATLTGLISSSEILIKQSTGVNPEDVAADTNAQDLYKLLQKIIIADLYENRLGSSKINPITVSLYAQLEAYKLKKE